MYGIFSFFCKLEIISSLGYATNPFNFGEVIAYDIDNKFISKESSNISHSIPEEAPGYGKTPVAYVRDFICDKNGLNNEMPLVIIIYHFISLYGWGISMECG